MTFIKIPVTDKMETDWAECEKMADVDKYMDCSECSLNGGDECGCLGYYEWCADVEDLL